MCDECATWRTAYLASLTAAQRTALRALADLSGGYGAAASGATEGWVFNTALRGALAIGWAEVEDVLRGLLVVGVIARRPLPHQGAYRLTEFGAAVVAALAQQEGETSC